MDMIKLHETKNTTEAERDLCSSDFSTVSAYCCSQPSITCKCFNSQKLTFVTQGRQQSSISNTINPRLTDELIHIDLPSCLLFPLAALRAPIKLLFEHALILHNTCCHIRHLLSDVDFLLSGQNKTGSAEFFLLTTPNMHMTNLQ